MASRRFVLLLAALFTLGASGLGCSGLLYHPTHEKHYDPAVFGLKPEETLLEGRHAWLFRSSRRPAKALVVFFHGNAENLTSHFASLSFLPREGFDYVIFDYRGYGLTEGKPSPESTLQDGLTVLKWSLNQKVPLVLFGQSLGGAVLMRSLQEIDPTLSPEERALIKLVALDSTFRSYKQAGRSALQGSWLTWPFQWLPFLLLSDGSAPSLPWPEHYRWLVLHGSEDRTIQPRLGAELYDSLPAPKQWLLVPGAGHIQSLRMQMPGGRYPYREKFVAILDEACGFSGREIGELSYRLPFPAGKSFEVIQGPGGRFSHRGEHANAIDFSMPEGSPVLAMRDGTVVQVIDSFTEGGPSESLSTKANRILIEHEDGTLAEYTHLAPRSAKIKKGESVRAGALIALSGNTGFTTEPHLHVRLYTGYGSFPMVFQTSDGPARVLEAGERVLAP